MRRWIRLTRALLVCGLLLPTLALRASPGTSALAEWHVTNAYELGLALTAAQNNGQDDVIYLAAGTYHGSFDYRPQDGRALILQGEPGTDPAAVILDGPGTTEVLYSRATTSGASLTLQDLTIQHGGYSGLRFSYSNGTYHLVLRRVILQDNTATYMGGGIDLQCGSNATLQAELIECTLRRNQAGQRGGGLRALASYGGAALDLTLVNCLFYGNQANWSGGALALCASETGTNTLHANLVHTTITGNTSNARGDADGPGGGVDASSYSPGQTHADLYNSIVYGNQAIGADEGNDIYTMQSRTGAETRVRTYHCDIGPLLVESGAYDATGSISADPLFRDAAQQDYHLTAHSPCVDAGTSSVPTPPGLPSIDLDGEPRPYGPGFDIGADEYVSALYWVCLPIVRRP